MSGPMEQMSLLIISGMTYHYKSTADEISICHHTEHRSGDDSDDDSDDDSGTWHHNLEQKVLRLELVGSSLSWSISCSESP